MQVEWSEREMSKKIVVALFCLFLLMIGVAFHGDQDSKKRIKTIEDSCDGNILILKQGLYPTASYCNGQKMVCDNNVCYTKNEYINGEMNCSIKKVKR